MSIQNTGNVHSLPAAADLSAKQFYAVKVNSSGQAALAAAGEFAIGILQNKPTAGQAATIVTVGPVSKAVAGGSITAGALVAADANGKLVAATLARTNTQDHSTTDPLIGSNVVGVALEGAATNDVFAVLLTSAGAAPTTAA
jgi:hypothetical protein